MFKNVSLMILLLITFCYSAKIRSSNSKILKTNSKQAATFLDGDIITIQSNKYGVNLVLDGSGCTTSNDGQNCGTSNALYGIDNSQKFVLYQRSTDNNFCLYSLATPFVFLNVDPTGCSSGVCGKVNGYVQVKTIVCDDTKAFKLVSNSDGTVSFNSLVNQNVWLRVYGFVENGLGVIFSTVSLNWGNPDPQCSFIVSKQGNIADTLNNMATKNAPIVYFNEAETFFPVNINSLEIQWPSNLSDSNSNVVYNYNAGKTFDNNSPFYVSYTRAQNGFYINYALLFAFNDCGPQAWIYASISTNVGHIDGIDKTISLCPADKHNGDLEHIRVLLDANFNVVKYYYGYHQWEWELDTTKIQLENGHPVAFAGQGSHAIYPNPGQTKYYQVWNDSSTTSSTCATICHKNVLGVSVPYPCTKSCKIGATTESWFIDYCTSDKKGAKWTPPLKLILTDVYSNYGFSNLTKDEQNLSLFKGRLGEQYQNSGYSTFQQAALDATYPVRKVCSSCDSTIKSSLAAANDQFQSVAPTSLARKPWFTNNPN